MTLVALFYLHPLQSVKFKSINSRFRKKLMLELYYKSLKFFYVKLFSTLHFKVMFPCLGPYLTPEQLHGPPFDLKTFAPPISRYVAHCLPSSGGEDRLPFEN